MAISTLQKARTFRWKVKNGINHSDTSKCLASVEMPSELLAQFFTKSFWRADPENMLVITYVYAWEYGWNLSWIEC